MKLKYQVPQDFLHEEVRRDYTITAEMKQVWAVQLDLLQELIRVCKENGLRVFADSGTLIGAVREKGFIPWDDDIDVAMPREDYDRLMSLSAEFRDPYFLQTITTHEYYINRFAQLHMKGTTAMRKDSHQRHQQCIYIDIFVLDSVPTTPRAFKRHYNKVKSVRLKLKLAMKLRDRIPHSWYRYIRSHVNCLSDKYWFGRFEAVMRSVRHDDRTPYAAYLCQRMTLPIVPLTCYDQTVWMPFEHIQVPVPAGYDEVLRLQYGDYMKPVKAPTQHGQMIFRVPSLLQLTEG